MSREGKRRPHSVHTFVEKLLSLNRAHADFTISFYRDVDNIFGKLTPVNAAGTVLLSFRTVEESIEGDLEALAFRVAGFAIGDFLLVSVV